MSSWTYCLRSTVELLMARKMGWVFMEGEAVWDAWFGRKERKQRKSLSHVQLFVTPWTIACQAPLSMGFSRQEYWSKLSCPFSGVLLNPGFEPRSSALQVDSLLSELPWKPKNTGLGSLSLLQGIFSTQKSNPDLLHFRQILYQLSHKGSKEGNCCQTKSAVVF